jgi:acetyltransferase-like isoleucine patch superfamily enzyme
MESFNRIAPDVKLGRDVYIACFANLYGCSIGDDTRIGAYVEIQKNAAVGARCKIQSHTFICEGVSIEDEVFVGHHVCFTNDLFPRACRPDGSLQSDADWRVIPTVVRCRASIGSGAVILAGVRIGAGAIIGAGAVVTKDVAARTIVAGNPARVVRALETDEAL